jgi:RimJ/RimL family protein N-acetyltransferase
VDYQGLVKRLNLPIGWAAPTELTNDDIRASALTRDHLHDDVRGINASLELIRRTRGGSWPTEPVTEDFNYVDLVWHEREFREGESFTYVVYDTAGQYLGCCYLYPMGKRTPLTGELLGHDVDVSWWVTPDAYRRGYYTKLYSALRHWIATEFPFSDPYYSNAEVPAPGDD